MADVRLKDLAETASDRASSFPTTETRDIAPGNGSTGRVGRYEVHTEIASGGMATVHIGRLLGPVGFARTVAIKKLHPPFAKDPEFVASFLDEARLASRIRHPNVVSTLDVVATGGELFVVMEYVPGESLAQLTRLAQARGERVPPSVTAAIMVGVLHGLHAAHEARDENGEPLGIVHRDVSPHNVLVGTDGGPHLIDFGVAKARGRSQTTREGQIKGKISYMPPEQLLGGAIDRRADIFAAAIVLWETLTGRRLFQGVDDGDVLARVLHQAVEPPSNHASEISPEMDAVVLRGLSRDLSKRYSTAREMALAIEAAEPLAPPSRVGAWVESIAEEALADRSALVEEVERDALFSETGAQSRPSALSAPVPVERHVPTFAGTVPFSVIPPPMPVARRSLPPPTAPGPRTSSRPPPPESPEHTSTRALMALVQGSITGGPFGIRRYGPRFVVMLAAAALSLGAFGILRSRWQRTALVEVRPRITPLAEARPVAVSAPIPVSQLPTAQAPSLPSPLMPTVEVSPTPRPAQPQRRAIQAAPVPPAPTWFHPARETSAPAQTHVSHPEPPPTQTGAPSSASCDPPFWYDSEGNKRYYRNCTGP